MTATESDGSGEVRAVKELPNCRIYIVASSFYRASWLNSPIDGRYSEGMVGDLLGM